MPDSRDGVLEGRIYQSALTRARRKVAALKGLYVHAAIFAVVLVGLVLVDWLSGAGWWVQWVFIGWGIGVASHAVAVYFDASERVAAWEDRKVQQLVREYERHPGRPAGYPSADQER